MRYAAPFPPSVRIWRDFSYSHDILLLVFGPIPLSRLPSLKRIGVSRPSARFAAMQFTVAFSDFLPNLYDSISLLLLLRY